MQEPSCTFPKCRDTKWEESQIYLGFLLKEALLLVAETKNTQKLKYIRIDTKKEAKKD